MRLELGAAAPRRGHHRPSTSPTTRRRRSRCPPASRCSARAGSCRRASRRRSTGGRATGSWPSSCGRRQPGGGAGARGARLGVVVDTAGGSRIPVASGGHAWVVGGSRSPLPPAGGAAPRGGRARAAGAHSRQARWPSRPRGRAPALRDVAIPGGTVRVEMITSAQQGQQLQARRRRQDRDLAGDAACCCRRSPADYRWSFFPLSCLPMRGPEMAPALPIGGRGRFRPFGQKGVIFGPGRAP